MTGFTNRSLAAKITSIILCLLAWAPVYAAVKKAPAGLTGCEVGDAAVSSDAGVTVVSCAGPYGIYYSTNFGTSWNYADGGAYNHGDGRNVAINNSYVFVVVGNSGTIYKDSLNHLASGVPAWKALGFENVSTLTVSGNFLFYGDRTGHVYAINATTNALLQTVTISGVTEINGLTIDAANGYVYAVATVGNTRHAYRATFNTSSGSVGSFADISSNSGLPASPFIGTIGVSPGNRVYISARSDSDISGTHAYVSTNNGESFSVTTIDNLSNDHSFSSDGTVGIVGNYFTIDSGNTFTFLSRDVDAPQLQNSMVLLHPLNSEIALVKTGLGVARTTNLVTNDSGPSWEDSNSGLVSANVKALSQINANKSRVLVGLGTGVAFSENFTADEPTFKLSCLQGTCLESRVSLDPNSTESAIAGYNAIYRGAISEGNITWNELIASPSASFKLSSLQIPSSMSDKIIAGYQLLSGGPGGGLKIYNKSDGSLVNAPLSVPISTFIVLNSSVIVVGAGYRQDSNATSADRGIYISTDGGQSFTQMTDSDLPSTLLVNEFAYDSAHDILYAATENTSTGARNSGNGTVFILRDILGNNATDWRKTTGVFTDAVSGSDESFKTVAVDPDTGDVFVGADKKIWVSDDHGDHWYQYYTGLDGEDILVLTYDALVSGGPGGLQGYGGEPPSCRSGRLTARNSSLRKRNLLTTVVGRLTNGNLARESIILQEKKGSTFRRIATGKSNSAGKLTFSVAKKATTYRFVSALGDVLCKLKTQKR